MNISKGTKYIGLNKKQKTLQMRNEETLSYGIR